MDIGLGNLFIYFFTFPRVSLAHYANRLASQLNWYAFFSVFFLVIMISEKVCELFV